VQLVDDADLATPVGEVGELRVRGREPGVLVPRYYNNPEATAGALRGEWLYTGDLARQDEDGYFYFLGRKKDSLRRRGENVSAWEVERVFNDHPDVEECALIGVKNELADEDLKALRQESQSNTERGRTGVLGAVPNGSLSGTRDSSSFVDSFRRHRPTYPEAVSFEVHRRRCWDKEK